MAMRPVTRSTARPAPRPRESGASRWRLVEYNLYTARRVWVSAVVVGVVNPLVFILALGVGLGTLVNRHGADQLGVPYLVFVAPAFLTASALQIGASDASYPVMAGFKWARFFHGMAATPLTTDQISDGYLLWITLRQVVNNLAYLAIIAACGGTQRWWVLLTVPVATLTGVAVAAPVMALAATVSSEGQAFNILRRFVITPMFLFSGTFYPISRLPGWGQWLAYATPLYHGTQLARGAAIGHLQPWPAAGHAAYLLVLLVAGVALSRWRFRVRLTR